MSMTAQQLAKFMDSTILSATATGQEIEQLCNQANEYGFASVCINPRWVSLAADILHSSEVKVCTVIGFPLGADIPESKAISARNAIYAGADELDMVVDLAAVIALDSKYITADIKGVLQQCRKVTPKVCLKVIIEAAALADEQKKFVCEICSKLGVEYVKTSTGMHKAGGATIEDVKLMAVAAPRCSVKAAGGIRGIQDALSMIDAGARRIGTSAAAKLVEEYMNDNPTASI